MEGGAGATEEMPTLHWISTKRLAEIILTISTVTNGSVTAEHREKLLALDQRVRDGMETDAYRADPKKVATAWFNDVRRILGHDALVKWAVDQMAQKSRERNAATKERHAAKEAATSASTAVSSSTADASASRKRPLDPPEPEPAVLRFKATMPVGAKAFERYCMTFRDGNGHEHETVMTTPEGGAPGVEVIVAFQVRTKGSIKTWSVSYTHLTLPTKA